MGKRLFETKDGYRLTDILNLAESIGARVREGKKHQKVITYQGVTPCALGPTTGFKKHVLPWIHHTFPSYTNNQIYQALGRYA